LYQLFLRVIVYSDRFRDSRDMISLVCFSSQIIYYRGNLTFKITGGTVGGARDTIAGQTTA